MPTITTLVSFQGDTDGAYPSGSLIADANGNLFGTTSSGLSGTVFEIAKTATGYASIATILVSFNGTNGDAPLGSLIADGNGDLFGTTLGGGLSNDGTVFEVAKTASGYASAPTTLVTFSGANGQDPAGSLITDANGDLFGTTEMGGAIGAGTVFEIAKTPGGYASTPTTLASFNGFDGETPSGSLIADSAGDLFGTTVNFGANFSGLGTVFEIAKTASGYASTPTDLVSFSGADGSAPSGSLIMDAQGDLFGTTETGGANNGGTVFEIAKTPGGYASTPITLASFNGSNGQYPLGSLIMDASGDLFGTTSTGGANGAGTVFEIAMTANGYASNPTTLVSFNGSNGQDPLGSLIADGAGDLFGTTNSGGADFGTVFEITGSGFVVCYLAGTQIATPAGEIAVEQLAVGDMVLTCRGEARRIVWIGEGRVLATRGRRSAATPIIVRKGALSENVPYCDLRVTKGHSLYVDGVLIPVEFLVNHRSIIWDDHAQEVSLYHIELETHDVLLANGAPAESYRDDGNRWLFRNANSGWGLPPQEPCAPVLTGGPVVDAIWRRLLDRAGPRPGWPLTGNPDLHLMIDGKRVDAMEQRNSMHVFHLPSRPRSAHVRSRAAAPQELGIARDPRVLGVAVRRIVLADREQQWTLEAHQTSLIEGFHTFEPDIGIRWTDGDARVPSELFANMNGPAMLMLHLEGMTQYLDEDEATRVA